MWVNPGNVLLARRFIQLPLQFTLWSLEDLVEESGVNSRRVSLKPHH